MNKAKPVIKIMLDKERTLKLDLNAMVAFEEAIGRSLFDFGKGEKLDARCLRALLWACLLHEDETLTEKQVGAWISTDNMAAIDAKLEEVSSASMPEPKAGQDSPLPESPTG